MPSSPAVADGIVYFGGSLFLYALDASTGEEKWKLKTGSRVESSPAIAEGTAYIGSADGNLYAADIETGEEKWKFKADARVDTSVDSSAAVVGDTVYFGDRLVYALDIETGEKKWSFETEGFVESSPVVADGVVYIGSNDGSVYALE